MQQRISSPRSKRLLSIASPNYPPPKTKAAELIPERRATPAPSRQECHRTEGEAELYTFSLIKNLIEVMADERWERLVEQQGIAYAKTVAEAMNLKLDMDNPADREKLRREVLDLVAGRRMRKQKGRG
jgi:hypothetical protein